MHNNFDRNARIYVNYTSLQQKFLTSSPQPQSLPTSHLHTLTERKEKAMCHATGLRSSTCRHKWLTITRPCGPNMGFNSVGIHRFHTTRTWYGATNYFKAPMGSCPDCDKKGQYNGNTVRMVLDYGDDPVRYGGPQGQVGGEYDGYGAYGTGMGVAAPVICCGVM